MDSSEIYTLSLHDALPISHAVWALAAPARAVSTTANTAPKRSCCRHCQRSEEHTSELQSRQYLVCRLLLEKKKNYESAYSPFISRTFTISVGSLIPEDDTV